LKEQRGEDEALPELGARARVPFDLQHLEGDDEHEKINRLEA
jgi:hypothetical protein